MRGPPIASIAALCGVQALPVSVAAQSLWLDPGGDKRIALEWLKPNFDRDDRTTLLTSLTFLSLRHRLGDELILEADIPIAHFGESDSDMSETVLGNPYLGLVVGQPEQGASAQLGLRLPLVPDDNEGARGVGLFTDVDRWEASLRDVVPVTILASYAWRGTGDVTVRLRGGPSIWFPTGDGETELLLDYAAQVGFEEDQVRVVGGFSGALIVTEGELDFGERSFNELGAAAGVRVGRVQPGIHLRVPVDDELNNVLDFVVGLHVTVELRSGQQ